MRYLLYNGVISLAAIPGVVYLVAHPHYRRLLARFYPPNPMPAGTGRPAWFHACSVGEVRTVIPIIRLFQQQHPAYPVLLTVSTLSGWETACQVAADIPRTWFPFDHPLAVDSFMRRIQPAILALLETEIWPNVILRANKRNIPVLVINGRFSDRRFSRYKRFAGWFAPLLKTITAMGMQDAEHASRAVQLGARPERVRVIGNTKFDGAPEKVDSSLQERVRGYCGLTPQTPVLLVGSARRGDAARIGACWRVLRDEFPGLRLIIVPRHPERLREEVFSSFDESVLAYSDLKQGKPYTGARVLLVDTMGDLVLFYSLATVAVIGGSFTPRVNGHNPLEPAALGIPTVFGPHMRNFAEPAALLLRNGGAVEVGKEEDLLPVLRALLRDPGRRKTLGRAAQDTVAQNRGALARTVSLIEEILPERKKGRGGTPC